MTKATREKTAPLLRLSREEGEVLLTALRLHDRLHLDSELPPESAAARGGLLHGLERARGGVPMPPTLFDPAALQLGAGALVQLAALTDLGLKLRQGEACNTARFRESALALSGRIATLLGAEDHSPEAAARWARENLPRERLQRLAPGLCA